MSARFFILSSLLLAGVAFAQPAEKREAANAIEVSLGGSTVVRVPDAGRVTLTDPAIADVSVAGGGLLVIGRKVGETNLIMSGARNYTYLVKVTLPAQAIQNEVQRLFPREDIEVRAVGGALVLVGSASSAPVVTQVEQVALGYLASPSIQALGVQPNVINLLEVKGRQQVLLEATFAEVNRTSLREMGVNFYGNNDKGTLGAAVANGNLGNPADGPILDRTLAGPEPAFGSFFFGVKDGAFPFYATLNLLARKLLSKTLAQPKLVALSGQKATFLAGGELPIAVPSGPQQVTISFKPFGIQLAFTPTVLSDKTIQLDALVEVSAPDNSLGVVSAGLSVPALTTRSTQTTVQLRDGQGFAIAGLLNDEMSNTVRKIPGLGDIPILGALFSSKEFLRKETELVVVITARLVDPQDADAIPALPGETTVTDPSDLELFLGNIHEANGRKKPARMEGDPSAAAPARKAPLGAVGFWR